MPRFAPPLQVYPKLYLSGGSMYDAKWWGWLVRGWELTVWNPVLPDLGLWGPVALPAGVFAWLAWKLWRRCGGRWQQVSTRGPVGRRAATGDAASGPITCSHAPEICRPGIASAQRVASNRCRQQHSNGVCCD